MINWWLDFDNLNDISKCRDHCYFLFYWKMCHLNCLNVFKCEICIKFYFVIYCRMYRQFYEPRFVVHHKQKSHHKNHLYFCWIQLVLIFLLYLEKLVSPMLGIVSLLSLHFNFFFMIELWTAILFECLDSWPHLPLLHELNLFYQ